MRTLIYVAKHIPTNRKKLMQIHILLVYSIDNFENIFGVGFKACKICSESKHVFTF